MDGKGLCKDPDGHVRAAIGLVFTRSRELGIPRRMARELGSGGVRLPTLQQHARGPQWRKATYSQVRNILRNAAMGGAYAWGKTRKSVHLDERDEMQKSRRKVPLENWKVLLPKSVGASAAAGRAAGGAPTRVGTGESGPEAAQLGSAKGPVRDPQRETPERRRRAARTGVHALRVGPVRNAGEPQQDVKPPLY